MRTIKFSVAALLLTLLGLASCIKHEVIPAPTPVVDLNCHFQGKLDGITVEYTEHVNGFHCNGNWNYAVLTAPDFSSAIYFSEILSTQTPTSIRIDMGRLMWDGATTGVPDLTQFNNYFLSNTTPAYSDYSLIDMNGFQVTYKDGSNVTWKSKENSVNFQDVTFSNIQQESDSSGDYSQFLCSFDCYVYHLDTFPNPDELDSIRIQNALFEGWFKR